MWQDVVLRVLSCATVYPAPQAPQSGLFVRARLQAMAEIADVTVIAPVARVAYSQGLGGLFVPFSGPSSRRDGLLQVWQPSWLYPPAGGPLNAFALALQIGPLAARLHRERRFDILDAHFGQLDGIAAALLAPRLGVPFAVTLRGSEADHAEYPWRRRAMAWSLRRAALVIALSQRLADLAVSLGAVKERVRVIPNGIDGDVFHARPRDEARSIEGLGREKLLLTAGHLIELKGHHLAIRALRGLLDRGHDALLWIAGGSGGVSSYEPAIRREIAECGLDARVRLLGGVSQERLARLMAAADVFCLASRREGWPNVLQEAMACGLPAVAHDVGAVPQMITSSDYGLVVPANDPDALLDALDTALRRAWDRAAISARGLRRSWPAVATDVLHAFKDALR